MAGVLAWPAKVTGSSCLATHSWVSVEIPDLPANRFCQVVLLSPPSGVVAPIPVTTTFLNKVFSLGP